MALSKETRPKSTAATTTLRVPSELRDEIAHIAERRGTSMLDVVTDAVHRLQLDDWWSAVRSALDDLDPSDIAVYHEDANKLDAAAMDGLGD